MLKSVAGLVLTSLLWIYGGCRTAQADETKPVFDVDCVSFAGRFLESAPLKKKAYPGLAVDGTTWSAGANKHPVIERTFSGEAAERAGVEQGDEIISINGYPTEGLSARDIFIAYHMFSPNKLTETLVVQKKDGSQKTLKLGLRTLDKCDAAERTAWLDMYKTLGY